VPVVVVPFTTTLSERVGFGLVPLHTNPTDKSGDVPELVTLAVAVGYKPYVFGADMNTTVGKGLIIIGGGITIGGDG